MIRAAATAGAAALHRRIGALFDADVQTRPTPINFRVPAGACDCHVHVFGDPRRFPLAADRPYTPPPAPVEELRRLLGDLHMDRVVIVSPAVYGTNNDCTVDAIHRLGSRARGIALVAPQSTTADLDRLRRAGIRGMRLNFETFGVTDPRVAVERFRLASTQAAEQGWHIQVNTRLSIVEALEHQILRGPTTVVFDHFAQAQAALGVDQPGFASLVRLLRSGRAYVKISATYRISARPPDYPDAAPLAAGAHRSQPAAHPVGERLAPSGRGAAAGAPSHGPPTAAAGRRRPHVEPARPLGAGPRDSPHHPGREPCAALRLRTEPPVTHIDDGTRHAPSLLEAPLWRSARTGVLECVLLSLFN